MRRNTILLTIASLLFPILGIYLFSIGFLQSRSQLSEVGSANNSTSMNITDTTWYPPTTRKVVFLLVDAFKWEFAYWDESVTWPDNNYQNRMPVIRDLVKKQPKNALLMKLYADAPTLTTMRIKCMMAGTLPSFVDFKNNLNTDAMTGDNIISQLHSSNKSLIAMGDDAWDHLFPNQFDETHYYIPFDVTDFESYDDQFKPHLFDSIQRGNFSMLVAHFLGVDHAGHALGQNTEKMSGRLDYINTIVQQVIDKIDNSTTLIVIGDHGMKMDGNHAGATPDETQAAAFIYSKTPLNNFAQDADLIKANIIKNMSQHVGDRDFNQIDMTPTLAHIFGVPIPFNNIGSIIPNLQCGGNNPKMNVVDCLQEIVNNSMINAVQFKQNVDQIQELLGAMPSLEILQYREMFKNLTALWEDFQKQRQSNATNQVLIASASSFLEQFRTYAGKTKDVMFTSANNYSPVSMLEGNVVVFMCVVALIFAFNALPGWLNDSIFLGGKAGQALNHWPFRLILAAGLVAIGCIILTIGEASAVEWLGFLGILVLFVLINVYQSWNYLNNQQPDSPGSENSSEMNGMITNGQLPADDNLLLFSIATFALCAYSSTVVTFLTNQDYVFLFFIVFWLGASFARSDPKTFVILVCLLLGTYVGDTQTLITWKAEQSTWFSRTVISVWDSKWFYLGVPAIYLLVTKLRKALPFTSITLNARTGIKAIRAVTQVLLIAYLALGGWEIGQTANRILAIVIFALNLVQFNLLAFNARRNEGDEKSPNAFRFIMAFTETVMVLVGRYSFLVFILVKLFIHKLKGVWWSEKDKSPLKMTVVVALVSYYLFWVTGHRPQVSNLNLACAFAFSSHFNMALSSICTFLNTLGPMVWVYFYLMNKITKTAAEEKPGSKPMRDIWKISLTWEMFALILFLGSSLNCFIQKDDVDLKNHFAPKYVFDVVITLTNVVTIGVSRAIFVKWSPF